MRKPIVKVWNWDGGGRGGGEVSGWERMKVEGFNLLFMDVWKS